MKKVVVYGLGKGYKENKELIDASYNVVAVCDKNKSLISDFKNGITLEQISDVEFDNVIITSINNAESMIYTLKKVVSSKL